MEEYTLDNLADPFIHLANNSISKDSEVRIHARGVVELERLDDGKTLQKASTGETISTKEYILKKASEEEELLSLLVDNVGALDHVIQCLHIDYVWNNVEIEEDEKKDEEENPFKDL